MILTALFLYGVIQGAFGMSLLWIVFFMFFDLIMAALFSPFADT